MRHKKIALKNLALITLIVSSFIACDKDFASIDSDIINSDNATHFNATSTKAFSAITYNKKLDPVQTNNLPLNFFGVYNDPLFGSSTSSVVTQVNSSIIRPVFGDNVQIDSVVLNIPYFSRPVSTNDEGETIYELDSVFGSTPINLSIYENNYFLRDFDPNSDINASQRYYSNASSGIDDISAAQLEGTLLKTINNFAPNKNEIQLKDAEGEITQRLAPAFRVKLDTTFWRQKIFDKEGQPELSNTNNFNNYFRGIYFKAESTNGTDGNLTLLNFGAETANITVYYTKDPFTEGSPRDEVTYTITFSGNRVNFISDFTFPIPVADETNGDEKLYIKGGQGSIAVIDLFNGLIEDPESGLNVDQLEYFRSKKGKWLINEANLVFYVDQTQVQGEEPERIYLYDLDNNTPLTDFFLDTNNAASPVNSRTNHLGKLERENDETDGQGIRYKIRITEHLNNILLRDSTNVKLGLAVSTNINLEASLGQYSILTDDDLVNRIPVSSTLTPKGTVLFGNNTTNQDKKLYLEIFYTEPNN